MSLHGYSVVVTNIYGSVTSSNAVLVISGVAPSILTQSASKSVGVGSNVTFTVSAAGSSPLSYQWNLNGSPLSNATNTSLILTNAQIVQSGSYTVVVTNAFGSATSSNIVLDVYSAPSILTQPTGKTVVIGSNVIFSVSAVGSTPLFYQWNLNGSPINNATNTALTLINVQLSQSGSYSVLVTNLYGSATSSIAILLVNGFVPSILTQPASQTAIIGDSLTLSVGASGTPALIYQWRMNGTNISGATLSNLALNNLQFSNAGSYSVVVTNAYGSATSTNAVITVNPVPVCVPAPSGLTDWWRGEGSAVDLVGNTDGTVANVTYVAGKVGQAFQFNGSSSSIAFGTATGNFGTNDFTIECWMETTSARTYEAFIQKRESCNTSAGMMDFLLGGGGGGAGVPSFSFYSAGNATNIIFFGNRAVNDGVWHHLAFVRAGTNHSIYIDGQLNASAASAAVIALNNSAPLTIGSSVCAGLDGTQNYSGAMDELSLYNRALASNEIAAIYNAGSAGKCTSFAPTITLQPVSQSVLSGGNVIFNVAVSGSTPLSYQWNLNGSPLSNATNTSLLLTNVQLSQAGSYSVVVTNVAGSATSSNAVLAVTFPPATIKVISTNGVGGGIISVPVLFIANGNENVVGFTLNFNPALLTYVTNTIGSPASTGFVIVNTGGVSTGKLVVAIALPAAATFPSGTNTLMEVEFSLNLLASATNAAITFSNQQLSDPQAVPLSATYVPGSVAIALTDFEGDVSPRPSGDRTNTITDLILLGHYAAQVDFPTNASEFQRADCAPRSTLGDGYITVIDCVQAGRYAAGYDPATPVGGPTGPPASGLAKANSAPSSNLSGRQIWVANATSLPGQTFSTVVTLEAQGNENAMGFSLLFDPAKFAFVSAAAGAGGSGGLLTVNSNSASSGRLGFVLFLVPNSTFPAGSQQVVNVSLRSLGSAGTYAISLADQPVLRQVSDAAANPLTDTTYLNGSILVSAPPANPSLSMTHDGNTITVSWPLTATNFSLQSIINTVLSTGWSNLPGPFDTNSGVNSVTVPISGTNQFFRLQSH